MQANLTTPALGDPRLPARFWSKIRVLPNGCWEWIGCRDPNGYGRFQDGTHSKPHAALTHRLAYELLVGSIPLGFELDHLCRNRACVNPANMQLVTHRENMLRGDLWQRRRTHCPQGHRYDLLNTYFTPEGWRRCRVCWRLG